MNQEQKSPKSRLQFKKNSQQNQLQQRQGAEVLSGNIKV